MLLQTVSKIWLGYWYVFTNGQGNKGDTLSCSHSQIFGLVIISEGITLKLAVGGDEWIALYNVSIRKAGKS